MNQPTATIQRLVDALQIVILTASAVDQSAHDLADESRRLVNRTCVTGVGSAGGSHAG
jgi:hypothetical protein